MRQATCPICKNLYSTERHDQVFCSRKCANTHHSISRRVPRICAQCKKVFHWPKDPGRKYCTRECYDEAKKPKFVPKPCVGCGEIMARHPKEGVCHYNERRYCSIKCVRRHHGDKMKNVWQRRKAVSLTPERVIAATVQEYLAKGGAITKCPDAAAYGVLYLSRPLVGGMNGRRG